MSGRNKLGDLNNHLFSALERVSDASIDGDKEYFEANLKLEIERVKAVAGIGKVIINNANLQLKIIALKRDMIDANENLPDVLKISE